ncbi:MAG: hypothetical protein ACQEVA_01640 [Myxococcota bacterium]
MESLIMGLFIGIPVALVVAAIIAYVRTNREYEIESKGPEEAT